MKNVKQEFYIPYVIPIRVLYLAHLSAQNSHISSAGGSHVSSSFWTGCHIATAFGWYRFVLLDYCVQELDSISISLLYP